MGSYVSRWFSQKEIAATETVGKPGGIELTAILFDLC